MNDSKSSRRHRKTLARRFTRYAIALGVLALGVLGIVALNKSAQLSVPVPLATEVTASDWMKGNPEASVVLVEYSDFQCPACATYDPVISQLMSEYGDRVLFVYRHFPLKTVHRNAEASAAAAEAAGVQGKFWEMHNMLFANQDAWSALANPSPEFHKYAQALDLNVDQFVADYGSDTARDQVEADYRSGIDAGVDSTPSFFLQGAKIASPKGYDAFVTLLEAELAKTSQAPEPEQINAPSDSLGQSPTGEALITGGE